MQSIDSARFTREGIGASYEEALQQAKYDAISGYYTLIMNRNLVDVAQQAVKDYPRSCNKCASSI